MRRSVHGIAVRQSSWQRVTSVLIPTVDRLLGLPSSSSFATHAAARKGPTVNGTSGQANHTTSSDNVFEEFIQSSTYPSRSLKLLEQRRDEMTLEEQRELLELVTRSKNRKLLERADKLPWRDPACLQLLIAGWAHLGGGIGATRAAQLLQDWPKRTEHPSSWPTLASYRSVLSALAEQGHYQLAGQILQQVCKTPDLEPDRDCFHRVLLACSKAQAIRPSLDCLQLMKNLHSAKGWDTEPNSSTYKIILNTYAHNSRRPGNGKAAFDFFQTLPASARDSIAYNLTLNALAKDGNYGLAEELFLQLLRKTTTVQTSSSAESGDIRVVQEAHENATTLTDPIPFRTVLKSYSQANTMEAAERAERFLHTVQPVLPPDGRAYTTVMAIWCKQRQAKRAHIMLEELLSLYHATTPPDPRLQPDPISFRTIIGCFSKVHPMTVDMAQKAQQILQDSHTVMGFTPNLITCNTVLKCWAQAHRPHAAEDFLQQMVTAWGVTPDIVSYNTVIQAHARVGNATEALDWLHRLASSTEDMPSPNTRTVTAVVTALSKQRTPQAAEQAERLLLQMLEWHDTLGWDTRPNRITYNAVLQCWAAHGNGSRAEYLLRQLREFNDRSEQPNAISYNTIIHAYSDDLEKGEILVEEMMCHGLQPTESTYQALMKALERDDRVVDKKRKAEELKRRYFPNLHVMSQQKRNNWKGKRNRRPRRN